ncbi:HAD family hydrolase [Plantactinospora soyae]|uniref:Hydrolase of the HAD superfamily n=1 Tax=Plantactinospora soyae TaxID=1544732 RepID=A0A927MC69_9ACTN|nr:HAD family hydrolase [Plantactinospora soyae]MBE1490446.1 putative hydrolase of the HAD superfamily [Plantactinospora soyae]
MTSTRHTHVLFDFFGTLVDYSASRTEQGYQRSHELLRWYGGRLDYPDFLLEWSRVCTDFDRSCDLDDHEFAMEEVTEAFLSAALGREPDAADVRAFVDTYVAEWNREVHYLPGIADLLSGLAADYRLAVVSNTHHAPLVPAHLAAMGVESLFDAVITSVRVGWRKPDPRIYAAALGELGVAAESVVFVGDSIEPDYHGPRRIGMLAYLIDPTGQAPVPDRHRLASVFDLPGRLAGLTTVPPD